MAVGHNLISARLAAGSLAAFPGVRRSAAFRARHAATFPAGGMSMDRNTWCRIGIVALALGALCVSGPALADWRVSSDDGKTFVKFGFLMQGRAETADFVIPGSMPSDTDTAQELYFRRARLLIGGQIAPKWTFFIETDSLNIGKGEADGTKNSGDVFLQDWAVTYNHSDTFKVDVGMLLIPFSHNGTQSAASLMPVDYGPFSFLESSPTDSRVGRDYGVLARGYLADKHFEYRAGVFSGDRGTDSTNAYRYSGRVVYHVFEPEAGLFYSGTAFGAKKILSIGASFDHQEEYDGLALDAYWNQPIGDENSVTVQLDLIELDGDTFLTSLPEQSVLYGEAGFYFGGAKLMPYVIYGSRDFDAASSVDSDVYGAGLGYYMSGHNRNLKLQYTRTSPDVGEDLDTITLQLQVFQY